MSKIALLVNFEECDVPHFEFLGLFVLLWYIGQHEENCRRRS